YLTVVGDVLMANINFYSQFVVKYLRPALPALGQFAMDVNKFVPKALFAALDFVEDIGRFLDDTDFLGFLAQGIAGLPEDWLDRRLSLAEFIEIITGTGRSEDKARDLREYLDQKIDDYGWVPVLGKRLKTLRKLVEPTFTPVAIPAETRLP